MCGSVPEKGPILMDTCTTKDGGSSWPGKQTWYGGRWKTNPQVDSLVDKPLCGFRGAARGRSDSYGHHTGHAQSQRACLGRQMNYGNDKAAQRVRTDFQVRGASPSRDGLLQADDFRKYYADDDAFDAWSDHGSVGSSTPSKHVGSRCSDARLVIREACKSLRRNLSEADAWASLLEAEWIVGVDQLRYLKRDDWVRLGIPLGLEVAVRDELSKLQQTRKPRPSSVPAPQRQNLRSRGNVRR